MSREKRAAITGPSVGRRRAIAGAAAAAVTGGAALVSSYQPGERLRISDESLLGSHGLELAGAGTRALLGVLAEGATLRAGDGRSYALDALFEPRHGGVSLVLTRDDGQKLALEILRHDPERPGPGREGALAVHLVNRGDGSTPTDESAGLAAMAVASVLVTEHAPPGLSTLAERCARAPLATLEVPA